MTGRIHDAAARGFEAAVERYERGRPGYPDDAVTYLVDRLGIGEGSDLIELGAGTGKLTELLVHTGARIVAIEPVDGMRRALERNVPTARVLGGTAEAIPLPHASADAAVAAQSFHWFDGDLALAEIHRVLRPEGRLGLVWNVRDEASDWSERLTAILDRLAGDGPRYRTLRWRAAFEETTLFGPLHRQVSYHLHQVTREAFLDRVLSVSYVASAPEPDRRRVVEEVAQLLDEDPELAGRKEIVVPYRTDVYWCARR
ncbi:MAG TPA: class I SAM-dependent methyltransferase [Actinomycetota bacterium]|nr:class I SAM-dependent methyltransferase [Actinomycetota bacterium]